MGKTYPPISLTIAPKEGDIVIVAGQHTITEQLDPKQFFTVSVGEYTIEIRRKAKCGPDIEKRRRPHFEDGKIIKLAKT